MIKITFAALLVGIAVTFSGSAGAQTGTWSTPVEISNVDFSNLGGGTIDANGNSLAVWVERTSSGQDQITSNSKPAGGNWGTPTAVFSESPSGDPTFCVCPSVQTTPAGFSTAVWTNPDFGIFTADRPSASGWSAATLLVKNASHPFFVMNSRGDAVIVWNNGTSVLAMLRPAGGTWGAQQTVVTEPHVGADAVGISDNGAVVVLWDVFDVTCNVKNRCSPSNFTLHASRQNPGSSAWVDSGSLIGPDQRGAHDARVVLDPAGGAMLVSTSGSQFNNNNPLVSATQGTSGGAWSPFTTVVSPHATQPFVNLTGNGSLAVDGAGNVTFVYKTLGQIGTGVTSNVFVINSSISSNTWSSPILLVTADCGTTAICGAAVGGGQLAVASSGAAVIIWGMSTTTTSGTTTAQTQAVTRASPTGSFSSPVTIAGEGFLAVNSSGDALVVYNGPDASGESSAAFAINFKP